MNAELTAISIAMFSTFAAFATALVNYLQSRHTKKTLQAQIITDFSERYAQDSMDEAIQEMKHFYFAHSEDVAGAWTELRDKNQEEFKRLFKMRRRINRYYRDIYKLIMAKAIDRRTARYVLNDFTLNLFYQVIIPVSYVTTRNPSLYKHMERTFRRILPKYGEGIIV